MNNLVRYWVFLVFFISQTLFDTSQAFPLANHQDVIQRSKRASVQRGCARKTWLIRSSGVITSTSGKKTLLDHVTSCSWIIHVGRGHHIRLEFLKFNVIDVCPGICECNYVIIRAITPGKRISSEKYCNEREPPKNVIYESNKVKIHLRLEAGTLLTGNSLNISYTEVTGEKAPSGKIPSEKIPHQKVEERLHSEELDYEIAEQKLATSDGNVGITPTPVATTKRKEVVGEKDDQKMEESGPSKMTVLLGVAIPVVMIFIIVVLIIAYYNHLEAKKQQQASESPQNGTNLGELILNSSVALAPMINLRKAKRESSRRREKANKLYDDMLQSWKETNENKKEKLKAKQESDNVWESYQKSRKLRRSLSRDARDDNKAFAMLVSNAINSPVVEEKPEDIQEEDMEEKPRPSSILIIRDLSDDSSRKRSSKVLSWVDLSMKLKDENIFEKRSNSADNIEMKKYAKADSSHIPAIVVSQPSFESEDSEACNETDRLIKDKEAVPKADTASMESSSVKPTYSCAEHVKDILRDSYGDENDEWWQKPKKRQSQGSLKESSPNSNVKYTAMAEKEDDID